MKDAKGHGSNPRGGHTVSQITLGGKVKSTQTFDQWRAGQPNYPSDHGQAGGATTRLPVTGGGQAKVARIAQAHGIQGGPFKVQSLALNRAGTPWATQKSYRNNTVAEHVAKYMRTDGDYTRVKVR